MKPRRYTSEGIVLARKNYAEADRLLVIFSKHFGKIKLLAKGVRKPKSRKRGHIEIFSKLRFAVSSTKGIGIMTEAEIVNSYSHLRKDLRKIAVAYYFCEVIGRITHDEEKNEFLYDLISDYLEELPQVKDLKKFRKQFIYRLLLSLGYWPVGKKMQDPDLELEKVIERKINSVRVGKKILEV